MDVKRVIELIRVSTESQAGDDRASIPAQRAVNRRTAAQYGLHIARTIEISDVSGAAVLLAPEMQEMMGLMVAPEIHGVVAREFSRLMRPENFSDYALLQAFADTKTVLYLPDGPIDLSSKSGRLMGTLRAAMAGLERTEILERIWSAKEEKRRAGKMPQSEITLPFGVGYDRQKERWYYTVEAEKVREAFRRFIAGETSYYSIGKSLGVDPYSLRVIMRNPIYTGWRVIDKRRDPSAMAHKAGKNGRQADRPKMMRPPEDVIRVQVIEPGLITEQEFQCAQEIMDMKKTRHWRTRTTYEHRFAYNGFLSCANCGKLIYTHFRRRDYYICSGRKRKIGCSTPYMRREKLEPILDSLLATRLTDRRFLDRLAETWASEHVERGSRSNAQHLQAQLSALQAKRERVVDAFIEGVIDRDARDERLGSLDGDLHFYRDLLMRQAPAQQLTAEQLARVFEPFTEWEFLCRDDKRQLLAVTMPEISVSDYQIAGIKLLPSAFGTEISRTDKGSSRPPA
ncbi:MAG: recombinase family protein [Candidatus Korobacteraceae bacterium]|jgi:DNA invertase Pin-like site-specific DNA recombinase